MQFLNKKEKYKRKYQINKSNKSMRIKVRVIKRRVNLKRNTRCISTKMRNEPKMAATSVIIQHITRALAN
jgi:hypothetical protein